jgi:hypothetical protein
MLPFTVASTQFYPIAINDEGEEDHFVVTFSDPVTMTADVVILDVNGDQMKTFSWLSPAYRGTPMGVGTFGERAVDM